MILENVFFTEINMEIGTEWEFIQKGWYALNVHKVYPDEKIGPDAFLDWARDLTWIEEKRVIVLVRGPIDDEAKEIIEFLNEKWKEKYRTITKECYKKQVDFILVS